jgi:hypothetical protein
MNNIFDIQKASLEIINIKFPHIFLFKLFSYRNDFNDITFSIILRLFLKHHTKIATSNNLIQIFKDDLKNNKLSKNILNKYYKILNKKNSLLVLLKKLHLIYNNTRFWKKNSYEQLDFLNKLKYQFLGIYDCAKGGVPFHYKIGALIKSEKCDRLILFDNIKERLNIILKLFGIKLFNSLEIPIITTDELDELSNEQIIKYLFIIFEKINELLIQTIKLFELYNLYNLELKTLLTPIILNINTLNIESETDIEDINLYTQI